MSVTSVTEATTPSLSLWQSVKSAITELFWRIFGSLFPSQSDRPSSLSTTHTVESLSTLSDVKPEEPAAVVAPLEPPELSEQQKQRLAYVKKYIDYICKHPLLQKQCIQELATDKAYDKVWAQIEDKFREYISRGCSSQIIFTKLAKAFYAKNRDQIRLDIKDYVPDTTQQKVPLPLTTDEADHYIIAELIHLQRVLQVRGPLHGRQMRFDVNFSELNRQGYQYYANFILKDSFEEWCKLQRVSFGETYQTG